MWTPGYCRHLKLSTRSLRMNYFCTPVKLINSNKGLLWEKLRAFLF